MPRAIRRLFVCGVILVMGFDVARPDDQPEAAAKPVPLNPQKTVLLDQANKRLLLKTRVVLREGVLEMFLCKAQTKEHESVLAVDSEAYIIHAGLLALGVEAGTPVRYRPEFQPPSGRQIDVYVNWTDAEGQPQRAKAQTWVRSVTRRYFEEPLAELPAEVTIDNTEDLRYDKQNRLLLWFGTMSKEQQAQLLALSKDSAFQDAVRKLYRRSQPRQLDADWVFAGSGFYKQQDGTEWYQAEAGNIICVANFSDAMMDLSIESSASNGELLFEPFTERIPPLETPVTVELIPAKREREASQQPETPAPR